MNRTGHKGRVDGSHQEVVQALRSAAISATSIASVGGGVPDVLWGFRGVQGVLEVKVPGGKLSADEKAFHERWPAAIPIVTTGEEAVLAVLAEAKRLGVV